MLLLAYIIVCHLILFTFLFLFFGRLVGNPICQESDQYCTIPPSTSPNISPRNCETPACSSDQISSPNCKCAYPYMGSIVFRVPTFSDIENQTNYESIGQSLLRNFRTLKLPVDSVFLTNPRMDSNDCLKVSLQVFPYGEERFNRTGISMVGSALSNFLAAFYFKADQYQHFEGNYYTFI